MTRSHKIQISLVGAGMLAWAWFGMGSWLVETFILVAVFWAGLPALGFCVLVGLYRLKRDGLSSLRWAGWVAGAMCVILATQWLGVRVCRWEVSKARSFVSEALPAIESFRAREGRYPSSLDELQLAHRTPRLFQYYQYESGTFGIGHTEPCSLMGGWRYNLTKHEWENVDWD